MSVRILLFLISIALPEFAFAQTVSWPPTTGPNVTGPNDPPTPRTPRRERDDEPHEPVRRGPIVEFFAPPLIAPVRIGTRTSSTSTRTFAAPATAERPSVRQMLHTIPVQAYAADIILMRIDTNLSEIQIAEIATEYNLVFLERFSSELLGIDIVRFRLPNPNDLKDVLRKLQTETRIRAAQPEYVYLPAAGGEPALQYAAEQLHLPDIHRISTGEGIKIAVIDTAIDATHPEFSKAHVSTYSAYETEDTPVVGHGSGIVGILVADDSLLGIAPGAHILSAQAFRGDESGKITGGTLSILRSVEWAFDQQAPIFNLSFAGYRDPLLEDAIFALAASGAIPVAAAGNDGTDAPPAYPAAYEGVIAVTASAADATLYSLANNGAYIDLTAPGVDLLVPANDQSYALASGTSLATAYVSGTIAVLMAHYPDKTPEEIVQIILDTATDIGERGLDTKFGYGQINPLNGLNHPN